MKYFSIGFFLLISASGISANTTDACWKHPEAIPSITGDVATQLYQSIPKKDREAFEGNGDPHLLSAYLADPMNDGHKKYIFVVADYSGSGRYQSFVMAKKTPSGMKWIGELPKYGLSDMWYGYVFDPAMMKLCGKTYVLMDSQREVDATYRISVHHRDAYLVENNATKNACDNNWSQFELSEFENSPNKDQPIDDATPTARGQFEFYLDKCKEDMRPDLYASLVLKSKEKSAPSSVGRA